MQITSILSAYFIFFSVFYFINFFSLRSSYDIFIASKRGHYVNFIYFLLFSLKKGNEKNGDEGHLRHKVR